MSMYRTITISCDVKISESAHDPCSKIISFKAATFTDALMMLSETSWSYFEDKGKGTGVNAGKFLCFVHMIRHQMIASYDDEAKQMQESETPPDHPEAFPSQDVTNEQ